jgi:uncharacterized protein YbjT (DUF2867 family)
MTAIDSNAEATSPGPVLVTGAAGGEQGKTGWYVTRLLLERGRSVRAFVHRLDERSQSLAELGAEIVAGDLTEPSSIRDAMAGVHRAYFTYPVTDGLLQAAAAFAAAARSAELEQVVNLSQWLQPGSWDHPTPHQTRHWLVENIFEWAGVGVVHLDAAVFYDNLRALAQRSLASAGVFAVPWGRPETALPFIGAEDVARVAVAVLTGPPHPSGTVLRLCAGAVTNAEIVETFSELLGRRVSYVELSDEQWADAATAAGVNAIAVEHLSNLWRFLRVECQPPESMAGFVGRDDLEALVGQPPQSLREYLYQHKDDFAQSVAD